MEAEARGGPCRGRMRRGKAGATRRHDARGRCRLEGEALSLSTLLTLPSLPPPFPQVGDTLEEFLVENEKDPALRQVMMCLGEAIRTIAFKVRTASCGATACVNTFGDEQLAVDLLADKLLFEALKYSGAVKYACSEEVPEPVDLQVRRGKEEEERRERRERRAEAAEGRGEGRRERRPPHPPTPPHLTSPLSHF